MYLKVCPVYIYCYVVETRNEKNTEKKLHVYHNPGMEQSLPYFDVSQSCRKDKWLKAFFTN